MEAKMFEVVRVKLVQEGQQGNQTKAKVNVLVAGAVFLNGIRVVDGKHGLFVSWPAFKGQDGKHHAVFYPKEKYEKELKQVVMDAYDKAVREGK